MCGTALFMIGREYFIAYCRCREAVTLFWILLSPYSVTDLRQFAELHFSLTDRGGESRSFFFFFFFFFLVSLGGVRLSPLGRKERVAIQQEATMWLQKRGY
jgi:hypothetical protein